MSLIENIISKLTKEVNDNEESLFREAFLRFTGNEFSLEKDKYRISTTTSLDGFLYYCDGIEILYIEHQKLNDYNLSVDTRINYGFKYLILV